MKQIKKLEITLKFNKKIMENKFVDGLIFSRPSEKAPAFIKGKLSVKVEAFIAYITDNNNNGWVNMDLLESKDGKTLYFKLNDYKKPENGLKGLVTDDTKVEDIPF